MTHALKRLLDAERLLKGSRKCAYDAVLADPEDSTLQRIHLELCRAVASVHGRLLKRRREGAEP